MKVAMLASVAVLVVVGAFVVGCSEREGAAAPSVVQPQVAVPSEAAQITQKLCPVMGMPIDKQVFVDHDGTRVYFCCTDCLETFKQDPARYMAKLNAEPAQEDAAHDHAEHGM